MKVEATLRNTLLKELLEKRKEEGRREALQSQDELMEARTIDAKLAKEVGDFLAQKYNPSRTRRE
jgi:hypothetical protein